MRNRNSLKRDLINNISINLMRSIFKRFPNVLKQPDHRLPESHFFLNSTPESIRFQNLQKMKVFLSDDFRKSRHNLKSFIFGKFWHLTDFSCKNFEKNQRTGVEIKKCHINGGVAIFIRREKRLTISRMKSKKSGKWRILYLIIEFNIYWILILPFE